MLDTLPALTASPATHRLTASAGSDPEKHGNATRQRNTAAHLRSIYAPRAACAEPVQKKYTRETCARQMT
jgi:hypothetical protein